MKHIKKLILENNNLDNKFNQIFNNIAHIYDRIELCIEDYVIKYDISHDFCFIKFDSNNNIGYYNKNSKTIPNESFYTLAFSLKFYEDIEKNSNYINGMDGYIKFNKNLYNYMDSINSKNNMFKFAIRKINSYILLYMYNIDNKYSLNEEGLDTYIHIKNNITSSLLKMNTHFSYNTYVYYTNKDYLILKSDKNEFTNRKLNNILTKSNFNPNDFKITILDKKDVIDILNMEDDSYYGYDLYVKLELLNK